MDPRSQIIEICQLLYDRGLANTMGGSVSIRDGKRIYMTRRHTANRRRWNIDVADIVVWDPPATPKVPSRLPLDSNLHLLIYERIPQVHAVIRAYPQYATVFAAASRPIPPAIETMEPYGTIPVVPYAPLHSPEVNESTVAALEAQRERVEERALAVLQPKQALVVAGRDLDHAFEAFERIDGNARCLLLSALLRQ